MIGQTEGFLYTISAVIKGHELHENAQASVNQTPHKGLESSSARLVYTPLLQIFSASGADLSSAPEKQNRIHKLPCRRY
jgi:hypothetical protein